MDAIRLPDTVWRHRPGLAALTDALGAPAGQARFVGGAVRDALLGIDAADIDIATVHAPQTVLDVLKVAGIRSVPTGLAHGTITAVLDSGPVEVTTLRRDVSTDGRRATVAFTDDWKADAARRDFTMNALYADPTDGRIFDYFGGLTDLEARRVRFIGEPLQRIAEDHLRILRFFRFLARFGDEPDANGLAACVARANDLMALSRERIADELLKLLVARDADRVVALMVDKGILAPVLPEITMAGVGALQRLIVFEQAAAIAPDAIRRLAALLPQDARTADAVGSRLKLSNAQRKRLISASDDALEDSPRVLAYRIGREAAIDRLLRYSPSAQAAASAVDKITDWEIPRLPLTGGALISRGIEKGPAVARLLRQIEDQWVADGFPGSSQVDALADTVVDRELRRTSNSKA